MFNPFKRSFSRIGKIFKKEEPVVSNAKNYNFADSLNAYLNIQKDLENEAEQEGKRLFSSIKNQNEISQENQKIVDKRTAENGYYDPQEQLEILYGGQKELGSQNALLKKTDTVINLGPSDLTREVEASADFQIRKPEKAPEVTDTVINLGPSDLTREVEASADFQVRKPEKTPEAKSEGVREGHEPVVYSPQGSSDDFNLLLFYQKGILKPISQSQLPIILPKKAPDLKNGFNAKEYMGELRAGVQKNEDKSDFWKRAAIRNAEIAVKAYEENPTSKALEYLKKIKDSPDSIEPGVMDYVATNPNTVKGVAGGAGLIALTNFLMSDRKGQMTNDELYSQ